jgi:hypothetical protein
MLYIRIDDVYDSEFFFSKGIGKVYKLIKLLRARKVLFFIDHNFLFEVPVVRQVV